eukprot:5468578-Pyramimonas_sp.AAC.2
MERDRWQHMLKVASMPIGLEQDHNIDLATTGFVDDVGRKKSEQRSRISRAWADGRIVFLMRGWRS